MSEEPPSDLVEPQRIGLTKKIQEKIREIYQNFSYKPRNKQEIAGSIRDSSVRGVLEKGTLSMMEGVLKVSTSKVREIMIPKPQIVFVDSKEDSIDFLPRIIKSQHSRFPVINKETDEIEGILLAKDLLPLLSSKNKDQLELDGLLRPAVLVPESKKLNTLLDEFRSSRNHMAIVIDEYGGITGLVTIEEFNDEFESTLSNKDFDTLGGIVMHHFARFPKINDAISIDNLRFIIASTEKKRLKKIKVIKS